MERVLRVVVGIACAWLAAPLAARAQDEEPDPPQVALGERLFLETRFAELFARFLAESPAASANDALPAGDPVLDSTVTRTGALPGPFAGRSMNCRQCHLVDEQLDAEGGGMRAYADFARRSPLPFREEDGLLTTARNSPPLVGASLLPHRGGALLHFDAEFAALPQLVQATLAGRNYGYLPLEAPLAIALVARVIREDDGSGELATEFGGLPYRALLQGDASVPAEQQLPAPLHIADVDAASDRELFERAAELIAAYVDNLRFEASSPFDEFLERNALPRAPRAGESDAAYTARLAAAVRALRAPVFVGAGEFEFHDQPRVFGPAELAGLQIFLAQPPRGRGARPTSAVGNCAACHPAPHFTDFDFHNTGVSQDEYERVHGAGRFAALPVPGLAERRRAPERWLPATAATPHAAEPFRRPVSAADPLHADLGLWNVYANEDFPAAQAELFRRLCRQALRVHPRRARQPARAQQPCSAQRLLELSLASFKTPGLRDGGHSAPYFHDGSRDDFESVVRFYLRSGRQARAGALRNADPELGRVVLGEADVDPLVRFLRSLDEDYS